ncbi:VOC family protein [Austwickia chelonae]|uniref:VOC family protein n=1 Tax=Austwickia chelonae TaxID=100225 RepID=UPI000E2682A6|nr:VOC family protein [Austwickia chelonae]
MSRVIHFEIHAADVPRAVAFYQQVFGWQMQDWSEYVGAPYYGVVTGEDGEPGINGAIMQRQTPNPEVGGPVAGAVLTVGTEDYDALASRIEEAGGTVAMEKFALPGMAWQGYYHDTENNVFGLHQPDPEAA